MKWKKLILNLINNKNNQITEIKNINEDSNINLNEKDKQVSKDENNVKDNKKDDLAMVQYDFIIKQFRWVNPS